MEWTGCTRASAVTRIQQAAKCHCCRIAGAGGAQRGAAAEAGSAGQHLRRHSPAAGGSKAACRGIAAARYCDRQPQPFVVVNPAARWISLVSVSDPERCAAAAFGARKTAMFGCFCPTSLSAVCAKLQPGSLATLPARRCGPRRTSCKRSSRARCPICRSSGASSIRLYVRLFLILYNYSSHARRSPWS